MTREPSGCLRSSLLHRVLDRHGGDGGAVGVRSVDRPRNDVLSDERPRGVVNEDDVGALRVASALLMPQLLASACMKVPNMIFTKLMHALSLK